MFKFDFCKKEGEGEKQVEENEKHTWFPITLIPISEEHITKEYKEEDITTTSISNVDLKLVRTNDVVLNLKNDKHENIIKAESQHSDLITAVYEGGLKVWECSYDLGKYLISENVEFENKKILDLGCGAGVLGIIALLKGATVHFQDYNAEVIELVTIPNVLLNFDDKNSITEKTKFYAGDWAAFSDHLEQLSEDNFEKYDIILSSETIYNSSNNYKLYDVFKRLLKTDGVSYIAGKTYYFGVGGGMRQFESLVKDDNKFDIRNVWKSEEGLQREIIKLTLSQK